MNTHQSDNVKIRSIDQGSSPFIIQSIGSLVPAEDEKKARLFSKRLAMILWIQYGEGEMWIDSYHVKLEDNIMFYITPGQLVRLAVDRPVTGFLISFEKGVVDLFDKKSFQTSRIALLNHCATLPCVRIDPATDSLLDNIAQKLLEEYNQSNELRAELISGFLRIIMIYLTRQCIVKDDTMKKADQSDLATMFFAVMEKHFNDRKQVKEYAEILGVTPGHLNQSVKRTTGYSASYHIQQRVILEAKRKFIFQRQRMKEIAYTLGFCDPAHFSRFFKKCAGVTFSDFRKAI